VILGLPAVASAATVTGVRAAIVPIPGFRKRVTFLVLAADVEIEGRLEGNELPVVAVADTGGWCCISRGTRIDPQGFPTCTVVKLEEVGPEGCPKQSRIADGTVGVADQIGSGEATREEGALEVFITPGNGVVAYANAVARSPRRSSSPHSGKRRPPPTGRSSRSTPAWSTRSRGAAGVRDLYQREGRRPIRKNGKTYYYGRVPANAPKAGSPARAK